MRLLPLLTLTAALCAPALSAQSTKLPTATMPACDGVLVNIRTSDIKPDSSMDKFLAAVTAQKAWYTSHGYTDDQIFVAKILVRDPDTKAYTYSDKQAMTYHFYSPASSSSPAHDAAWDAFVKLFADSSVIKESTLSCVPKAMVPVSK
jgi:hypothetical protein